MTDERDPNAGVIADFRSNQGEVRAPYDNPPPMVLPLTIGALSGREQSVPMHGLPDGDAMDVFATAHGSGLNPDWYHNIVAHRDIVIEKGTETVPVHATVLAGVDRDAILTRWIERLPLINGVLEKTDQIIPVIRLEPRVG